MTPIIEAHGLTKRFGDVDALDGLDLVAESGHVTALLGPNGAGKTTFVSAVATLLRPDGGEIRVAGIDACAEPKRVREIIGLAGQYASVEPAMTGIENLRMVARLFGLEPARRRAPPPTRCSSDSDLADAGDRLVRTYSGGMRRRLDLGASLVGRPQLLLLDEPTTGLDPRGRMDLWSAIREPGGRRHRRAAHHAVPRGSRPAGAPHRDHRPRARHHRRNAGRVEGPRRAQRDRGPAAVRAATFPRSRRRWHGSAARRRTPTSTRQRVSARVEGGGDQLRDVVRLLDERGIEVDDVGLRRPSLDEVFLAVTGKHLDPTDPDTDSQSAAADAA